MRITYEGKDYDFDFDGITVKQAIKIEKHMGCTLAEWGKRLAPEDEDAGEDAAENASGVDMQAMQALGWLILFDGKGIPVEDADFKIVSLGEALNAALAAEQAAEAEAEAARPTPPQPPPNGSGDAPIPALS